jgi:hypothetical protein
LYEVDIISAASPVGIPTPAPNENCALAVKQKVTKAIDNNNFFILKNFS